MKNHWRTEEKLLVEFVEENKLLHENMHGSRAKHSIITAKLELDEEINNSKDKGLKVAVLSTDLSSAYDTVEHKLLWSKLEYLGFWNKSYSLIESYLEGRNFILKSKEHMQNYTKCQK